MKNIAAILAEFLRDERGVTAIEYGLIAAVLSLGIVTALVTIGSGMRTRLTGVATALQ